MKRIKFITLFLLIFGLPAFASEITILHTSDIHGRLEPINYKNLSDVGGASRKTSYYKQIRENNKNVLILDSGDFYQGSIYYQMHKGLLSAKILKYMGYDAVALGNHEFDKGLNDLKKVIKKSKTTFLSANLEFLDKDMKKLVKPYIIKEIDGEKILIIGVTTPKLKNLSSSNNVVIYEPIERINKIIEGVKADKIIVISHCGYEIDKQIANSNPKINLILGGHNHLFFEKPRRINESEIINSGEFGVYVSKVDFDTKKGINSFENVLITNDFQNDKIISNIMAKENKKISKLQEKMLTTSEIKLIGEQPIIESNQTNLGRIVLKSMLKSSNYDIVLVNSGCIRINKNLYGNISLADGLEILPFDNSVVKGEIQGKYLKEILELGKIKGRRYLQVYSKIKNIEDEKYYTVVTNEYISMGKDGYEPFKNIVNVSQQYKNQKYTLINFLKRNPKITEETLKMP